MRWRMSVLPVLLCLSLLCGCKGNALPAGMDEDTLLEAGQAVALLLIDGDYGAVHAMFREDVAESLSAGDVEALVVKQIDGAGDYRQISGRMTTGQSSNGEDYGVAVLYCDFTKNNVLFRLAFDPDMALIGLEVKKQ